MEDYETTDYEYHFVFKSTEAFPIAALIKVGCDGEVMPSLFLRHM